MAVKKTTRKKPVKKAVKKEEKPIELAPIEEMDDSAIISALRSLQDHPGWRIVKRIIDENIFEQERKILNEIFEKEPKYNDEDMEKNARRIYISIGSLPDREIKRLTGNEAAEEDYDPYYKKLK